MYGMILKHAVLLPCGDPCYLCDPAFDNQQPQIFSDFTGVCRSKEVKRLFECLGSEQASGKQCKNWMYGKKRAF